ncbi:ABC transporter permease [Palleronia sp. KMU-117]|uniref:ABC transporter permease n=1 Tax=Palleronia sp. KMU-117 TaxID=3434108 RepID=UPI003D737F20
MTQPKAPDQGRGRPAPLLAADGMPLKRSLQRSLRRQKLRAFLLVAPLLLFVLVTFIAPIADMLFRSVENQIVSETLPRTTEALEDWDTSASDLPGEAAFVALAYDLVEAEERKAHTRLGSRLNYETSGMSSLFRKSGREVGDIGEIYLDQFKDLDPAWDEGADWAAMVAAPDWSHPAPFEAAPDFAALMPETADAYTSFARTLLDEDGDDPATEEPWSAVHLALYRDLMRVDPAALQAWDGPGADRLRAAQAAVAGFEAVPVRDAFLDIDEEWGDPKVWGTLKAFAPEYTPGYFLSAVDLKLTPDGVERQDETQRIYLLLFQRTLFMSLVIMGACVLLGYPIAYLLASLPMRQANLLMILVLLPFWTSLLVRTSAWKVLLQQQGVINDILVWSGLIDNANRLVMINNQTGTIIAMTHILLPFMILPLYSVMKTIPPSYVRAARSLGATNWTAFWRVYFPQSVPGIGAGCILVFILAIGYYITPELVGGTSGTFISNRIAFHISSSLNWGLAAALGTILLAVVLILYWVYDRIVGIDNVSLG